MRCLTVIICIAYLSVGSSPAAGAQQATGLTPADYIEIQQLVARYAHAIDTCSNNGYDYADLYAPDGEYSNSRSATMWRGRDRLAEAAGGGSRGCEKLKTRDAQNRSHVIANHVIEASPGGAIGKSYLVYPGAQGEHSDADHSGHVGGYQDEYVKTADGWRFKSRIHVFPPHFPGSYRRGD